MSYAQKIYAARKKKKISQLELAARAGVQQTDVSNMERGKPVSEAAQKKVMDYLEIGELVTESFKIVHTDSEQYAADIALAFVFGGLFGSVVMYIAL